VQRRAAPIWIAVSLLILAGCAANLASGQTAATTIAASSPALQTATTAGQAPATPLIPPTKLPTPTIAPVQWPPTVTPTERPLPPPTSTASPLPTPSAAPTVSPAPTLAPTATQRPSPTVAVAASPRTTTIGQSVQGRPITATTIGNGPLAVAFVGDTHGGPERETDLLVQMAITYYREHPAEIPSAVTAYFIPTLNPDGLAAGTRFNADAVDLNRNWQTRDWDTNAGEPNGLDKGAGGPRPFSEPESRAMRDFLVTHHVAASIFYHLPWGGVYSEPNSVPFAQAVAQASGYPFHLPGKDTPYAMTGTAHRWADEHGQLSLLLELHGSASIEWDTNHSGMNATMRYVVIHH